MNICILCQLFSLAHLGNVPKTMTIIIINNLMIIIILTIAIIIVVIMDVSMLQHRQAYLSHSGGLNDYPSGITWRYRRWW